LTEHLSKRDLSSESPSQGMVMVFTGEGKGKTTAAIGTVIRAIGQGLKVYICFFMKGDYPYGERKTLSKLPNVTQVSFGQEEFVNPASPAPEQIDQARKALSASSEAILSGKYDLVVLDEANVAAAFNLIKVEDLIRIIQNKPRKLDLILTGRKADPRIIQMADLVTEMLKIKHPYDSGIPGRKGIEY
jgi:cob(I)alamin adenosyltransferase